MGTPTREWPWPWEGYETVRLSVGDDIMPPIRDQIVSHVATVVASARSVQGLEEGVRKFRNPYLPPFNVKVLAEKDLPDSEREHVAITIHAGRR